MITREKYTTSQEERKDLGWMIAGALAVGMLIGVMLACLAFTGEAYAEDEGDRWVICQPDSFVFIRERPRKTAGESGRLELGDRVRTDGKKRDGYIHIIDASTESGDGWVAARYLVGDPPVIETGKARNASGGRAAIRRYPGGKRTGWLKKGAEVTVYAWTAEWCVTSRGFIRSDCLEGE